MLEPIAVDFETLPIKGRPDYPPIPTGVALRFPGLQSFYLSWGHPTRNNCTAAQGMEWLAKAWHAPNPKLFHNAKFDLAVATEGLGFEMLPWDMVHDTMFLVFLADPHSKHAGLKPIAADWLNWPAEERDEVEEWIWANREVVSAQAGENIKSRKGLGKYIGYAPGDIVGRYAIGDVDRTFGLFQRLYPIIIDNHMGGAYDRERRVLPIFMDNEREGLRVDLERLEADCQSYGEVFAYVEDQLRKELRAGGLNFDADMDVASVLVSTGVVPEQNFVRTKPSKTHPNGQLSVSKDNLRPEMFTGPNGRWVAAMLGYRNRLKTCLSMFMEPWRDQALRMPRPYITTNWNQIRGQENGGTRTGRPSTNAHNFLNISKSFLGKDDGFEMPPGAPDLPLCREYILPDEGHMFLHRDFNGQELRIFGHGEQGDLWGKYQADPRLDVHSYVGAEMMKVAGREIARTPIKTLNFQSIYGGGIPALQNKLRVSAAEAKELKAFHDQALPGRKILNEEIKRVIMRGDPIRTVGGRLYFEEPPGPDGRSKLYKLLNYWVQGSAADLTKQAMIDWYDDPDRNARFLVQVYDEINVSAPVEIAEQQMAVLKRNMEKPRLTVPMLSDGKKGFSWGKLEKCE